MGSALNELMLRRASGTTHAPLALTAGQEPRLVSIPLGLLDPDPDQPRKDLGNLLDLEAPIGTLIAAHHRRTRRDWSGPHPRR